LTCTNCGTENEAARKFCMECGSPLAANCPACGAPNDPRAKFCGECGTPFGSQQPATTAGRPPSAVADQPVAERRLVSILFADLVGFTTLSENRDAEEIRDLLTRYFDTCRRLIGLYGGTIEKFIGDAVMAVWGAPTATEDDAERAVRAGLDLVQAVTDLGEEVGAPDLQARAGVLTGEAAVNLRAQGQGMVAGDLVNTASRIQSAAPPGGVFVGDVTRRATEAAIVYEDAGVFELKGKAEPVPLWRALRVVAGARGGLKSAGLEAPFVGRDRELRTVKELFFASAEDGKSHLASIIGTAGIGKSRLAWEFYKYFDGLPQLTYYHRGRCLAYGEGVAYWALAEMVKMRARIAEVEDPASAVAKLHASVEEHVPDPDERRWVEPRLAHLIGLEERTAADREDLFAAWRLFFERLAEKDPTVMVFEDMQWADAALVDFIEYLLEWSRNHPIFVLTLTRPEFLERRPTWGVGKRNFTSLYLEPLPREAMEELLTGLVPGLPGDLIAQILTRAEGIPLYAVETVRMLLDKGMLAEEGAVYRPTGTISSLAVPETLQALIAARLDGLAPQERLLIQDAAVLGKSFFKKGLASLSGIGESDLEPLLTSLVRKEILSQQADARSPEHGQYGFLQDLVKKVAYDTLSKRERKAKHLAAAAFIEEGWGGEEEEVVEVVAAHYLQAYGADPSAPDAPEIKSKAGDMLGRAGERAASLAAAEEALRYFEQALELADEPLLQAELHERASRTAWAAGRTGDARRHAEQAMATFDSIGLSHPAARVLARLGQIDQQAGHIDQAVERMERAYEVLSADEPDEVLATLAAQIARLLYFRGRHEAAAERIELALDLAETLRLPEVLAHGLNTKGLLLQVRGRFEETAALLEKALEVALAHDLTEAADRTYVNLGALASYQDRNLDAANFAKAGLELARRVGDRPAELRALANSAAAHAAMGRWEEAASRVNEILGTEDLASLGGVLVELLTFGPVLAHQDDLAGARRMLALLPAGGSSEDVQTRMVYRAQEAPVLRAEGRIQEALAAATDAWSARSELGLTQDVKEGLVVAIEISLDLGDLDRAEELLGAVEALRPGELTPFLQANGARLGARLTAARGDQEQPDSGFRAAAGIFRDLPAFFWLGVTLLEHGEWLTGVARTEEARPPLAEAREIFERLKALPWLDRLARVESASVVTGTSV
jgi:class 3 adenylate cyclase/tetratricopeptide (TPR) repeat protein